ncbi:hypothetical protein PR048_006891 [Dryococelus australis]|uniref:Uncharacterized protein n=1 Tax=Dryococelus australis TaxID=614101 RepID=A0ABQ9IEE5_9NEOP|nr:hypothetical protein PR048_006891 [Dryococelus australis]
MLVVGDLDTNPNDRKCYYVTPSCREHEHPNVLLLQHKNGTQMEALPSTCSRQAVETCSQTTIPRIGVRLTSRHERYKATRLSRQLKTGTAKRRVKMLSDAAKDQQNIISRRGRSQVSMEQRQNAKAGETGDPRENPPTSGTVLTSRSDPAGNRVQFSLVGGERPSH